MAAQEALDESPGAGASGVCELPDSGLYESRNHSYLLSRLSSPISSFGEVSLSPTLSATCVIKKLSGCDLDTSTGLSSVKQHLERQNRTVIGNVLGRFWCAHNLHRGQASSLEDRAQNPDSPSFWLGGLRTLEIFLLTRVDPF